MVGHMAFRRALKKARASKQEIQQIIEALESLVADGKSITEIAKIVDQIKLDSTAKLNFLKNPKAFITDTGQSIKPGAPKDATGPIIAVHMPIIKRRLKGARANKQEIQQIVEALEGLANEETSPSVISAIVDKITLDSTARLNFLKNPKAFITDTGMSVTPKGPTITPRTSKTVTEPIDTFPPIKPIKLAGSLKKIGKDYKSAFSQFEICIEACTKKINHLLAMTQALTERAGDDEQLANIDMQNTLQKQQQTIQMMNQISKMIQDTAMVVIRKIS